MRLFKGIAMALFIALPTYGLPTTNNITARAFDSPINRCGKRITVLDGDGNPHQNFYHVQVSDKLLCTDGECQVTKAKAHTITYSLGAGVGAWVSGGFAVEQSVTTSTEYTCAAQAGEKVCIWLSVAHTAYTVYDTYSGRGGVGCEGDWPRRIIRSPNSGKGAVTKYCSRNCRNDGDGYWNTNFVPKGGPGPSDIDPDNK